MIEVHDLQFKYPGTEEPALKGICFSVRQGEIFGLFGPSGAGKSTTQRVLIGLLHGYRGRVAIFGKEVRAQGRDYYQRIGVGFELPNVYTRLSARENLAFFAALYAGPTADPDALLDQVGLAGDADTRRVRVEYGPAGPEPAEFELDGIGDDPAFAVALRQPDLKTIHTLEATLEDVFIEVTGRALQSTWPPRPSRSPCWRCFAARESPRPRAWAFVQFHCSPGAPDRAIIRIHRDHRGQSHRIDKSIHVHVDSVCDTAVCSID
jgi:fluoroquinolone transport system ATP-binding protein